MVDGPKFSRRSPVTAVPCNAAHCKHHSSPQRWYRRLQQNRLARDDRCSLSRSHPTHRKACGTTACTIKLCSLVLFWKASRLGVKRTVVLNLERVQKIQLDDCAYIFEGDWVETSNVELWDHCVLKTIHVQQSTDSCVRGLDSCVKHLQMLLWHESTPEVWSAKPQLAITSPFKGGVQSGSEAQSWYCSDQKCCRCRRC